MNETLTLMLDGIWGRPKRFEGLLRRLRNRCGPAEIFHYKSTGTVAFEELGQGLVDRIIAADRPVNLIGFSMGGLVIRAAHLLNPTLPIRRAAFLNAPLEGSWLAYALPLRGVQQMRPNHAFIRQLKASTWNIPTLATWCPADTMVIPGSSARWHRATETVRCAIPIHTWPILSRAIWTRVVDFMAQPDQEPSLAA